MSTPVLNPYLKRVVCPQGNAQLANQIRSSVRQEMRNSPLAPRTSYDSTTLDSATEQADGFMILMSDLEHANLQLNVAVAAYRLPTECPRKIVFTLSFTLAPRHMAIHTIWSLIVRDPWILNNFDVVEMHVPNQPNFGWLTGVLLTWGLLERGLSNDGKNRIFRGNVLRFNTQPAIGVGKFQTILEIEPSRLAKEPNLVRSTGKYVREHGGAAARAFRLWLIENKHLTELQADEETIFTARTSVLRNGHMTAPPGLHADFPEEDDEGLFLSMLVHPAVEPSELNDGHKPGTHFLVLSGPPATQFFQEPVALVCSTASWKALEQQIPYQDATKPEKAITFEDGEVIKFYNNSIHCAQPLLRTASQTGACQQSQTRLLLRACHFPAGFPAGAQPLNTIQHFTHIYIPNPGNAM